MKKLYRIKKNDEFQKVFKKGKSFANRQFVVYVLKKGDQDHFRIGLSVSKKIGNAVKRNEIKRYLRQSIHELHEWIEQGNDYVIIARKPAADMNFHEVKKSIQHVFKVAKVIKNLKQ
ncbi:ribonuclease P protein component [Heyndrickxia oleronia]|uniref:Ribonuclease P protein component n=1 Tax=Heyndrickxia oleronia TaxID=38875 RepID=A0A8E2LGZ7_9BACI|nr:ribonuclease P protein component [Heyndrickxia oleronia]MEC1374511.1 ribonuclease P protein component [Heyndrickxia oleronia]OOP69714.1 ribonuclease P protein component [Heyndrickxia oleronia]QQZ05004.1 ribonuclease P protein component [Heyndrickxia oleronia]